MRHYALTSESRRYGRTSISNFISGQRRLLTNRKQYPAWVVFFPLFYTE